MKKCRLDKFYTNEDVANLCVDYMASCGALYSSSLYDSTSLYLEPSVGSGAMERALKEKLKGITHVDNFISNDIDGFVESTLKGDFLALEKNDISVDGKKRLVVYGNPPFGMFGSLAHRFIEKSVSLGAEYVCFILPNVFKRASYINKLPASLEVKACFHLPPNSFIFNGEPYHVNASFFILKRSDNPRGKVEPEELFTKGNKDDYDFAIVRAGGSTGKILQNPESRSKEVVLYLKGDKSLYALHENALAEYAGTINTGAKSLSVLDVNYFLSS